jgi:CheY-like chemotaxis protein
LRKILREALSHLTPARHLQNHLIDVAVRAADDYVEEDDPVVFRLFVHGPLSDAVESVFGPSGAEKLKRELESHTSPIEESGVVRIDEGDRPTTPAPKVPVVLIATSHTAGRDAYVRLLGDVGYALQTVTDAATAVAECAAARFDLIIADLDWLDVDGNQLAEMLQRALGPDAPPIIVLARRAATVPGMVHAVLRKPVDRQKLLTTVDSLLGEGVQAEPSWVDERFEEPFSDDPTVSDDPPSSPSPFVALLYEALGHIATPSVRNALLATAMEAAEIDVLPTELTALCDFVRRELHAEVDLVLGHGASDGLMSTLGPLLDNARDDGRASGDFSADSSPRLAPSRRSILLACDDPHLASALERRLRRTSYRLRIASDGHEALDACMREPPDVVVCDHELPTASGPQLAALLAKAARDRPPLVLMLCEPGSQPELESGWGFVTSKLVKPVDAAALASAIDAALAHAPRRR